MQVSLAPPLWKKTAFLPASAQAMTFCHSRAWKPRLPMLCLISSLGCLPLRSSSFLKMMRLFSLLTFTTSTRTMLVDSWKKRPSV